MRVIQHNEPLPENADDFALGVVAASIAWITNRTIVMLDGSTIRIPNGWEAMPMADNTVVIVFYDETSEVTNA